MKKILLCVVAITLGLAAIVIFCYPLISNYMMTIRSDSAVVEYLGDASNLSKDEYEEKKRRADEYNASLVGSVSLGDPFDSATGSSNIEDFLSLKETYIMATVEIPDLKVNLPVYYGTSEEVLSKGIGYLQNSSLPVGGKGTHSVLTGHTGYGGLKLFSDLGMLETGDIFYINCLGDTLAYEVDNIAKVLPDETELLQIDSEKDYVTLVTCTPFGINSHRLLVRGKRISLQSGEAKVQEEKTESNWMQEYQMAMISGVGVMVAILLVFSIIKLILFIGRKRKKNEK